MRKPVETIYSGLVFLRSLTLVIFLANSINLSCEQQMLAMPMMSNRMTDRRQDFSLMDTLPQGNLLKQFTQVQSSSEVWHWSSFLPTSINVSYGQQMLAMLSQGRDQRKTVHHAWA